MNILEEIVATKRKNLGPQRERFPLELVCNEASFYKAGKQSLRQFIADENKNGIIAEFKRRSPSRGEINLNADVEAVCQAYMRSGVSGVSVLTDSPFFGGSNADLSTVRRSGFCPILRKDFFIDEYMIHEASAIGADAILLIAAVLTRNEIESYTKVAHDLGLEVLLELHDKTELEKVPDGIDLLGVNNRNLKNFETSLDTSLAMLELLPDRPLKVAESGIKSASDLRQLKEAGYDAFLIGTQFMSAPDPTAAIAAFVADLKNEVTA